MYMFSKSLIGLSQSQAWELPRIDFTPTEILDYTAVGNVTVRSGDLVEPLTDESFRNYYAVG